MRNQFYPLFYSLIAGVLVSCNGNKKVAVSQDDTSSNFITLPCSKSLKASEIDSIQFPIDKNGYITLFDGETFKGWRGYGKEQVPSKWTIENGSIKFNGSGIGEAQNNDGGDLIFAHKFKNFELELEWKISKGGMPRLRHLFPE